jgi:hypothetical protein
MTSYRLTADEPKRFLQAFNTLAASKSGETDVVKYEVYFQGLHDLPIESVEQAARTLQKEPGAFLPDSGTWYRLADKLAAEMVEKAAQQEVLSLPAAPRVETDERERLLAARDDFVARMEAMTGRTLPADHTMKSRDLQLPMYGCSVCKDVGWVQDSNTSTRVRHCVCWDRNPVLQKWRATARVKKAASAIG